MTVVIRRIRPGDGPVLREVRLRALLESPSAFAKTHAEEVNYSDEFWAERAAASAVGDRSASFLAFDEQAANACGLVGSFCDEDNPVPNLVSMWVVPEHRGTDVASRLVDAVLVWARSAGYRRIELWVTRGNDRALALYRRHGFSETGAVAALPSDPCIDEIRMACQLTTSRP